TPTSWRSFAERAWRTARRTRRGSSPSRSRPDMGCRRASRRTGSGGVFVKRVGMTVSLRILTAVAAGLLAPAPAAAKVEPFPAAFSTRDVAVEGATIHSRIGGHGPVVLLLHGFGDTGDMWAPLAARLVKDHTVVVPDLRGMGLSSHPEGGYDKKSEARDIAKVLHGLSVDGPVDLVTHDIGNMVGYAFAAQYRDRVTRWVVMDAPLPGIGHWDDVTRDHRTW